MKRVTGILVKVDDFGDFDTVFSLESVDFENNLPHCVHLKRPTEFYRYIGGKRLLVYADEARLKEPSRQKLTLAITDCGKLTGDRLFGNLFICNADKNNAPMSLTDEDEKLIRSQIAEEYFGYFSTRFIKSEYKDIKMINCPFCDELIKAIDDECYYKNPHEYTISLVARRYYEGEVCGQLIYSSKPFNFCPVCGKKINVRELKIKIGEHYHETH